MNRLLNNDFGNKSIEFANIKIKAITKEKCFKQVSDYVKSKEYHYQISVNVSKLVYAQKDSKLLLAINSADIINADGMPIKIITEILTGRKITRMGGLDYMEGLAITQPDYRYFFLGATQEVVEKIVNFFKDKYHLNIVGWRNGYFTMDEMQVIIDEINEKKTDILYIALGTPDKEYMLYDLRHRLKCKLAIGVGGAFNIIAGNQKRAPQWVQNVGMEWLYRLFQEPRRMFKRYLYTNSVFIWIVLKEIFGRVNKNHKYIIEKK